MNVLDTLHPAVANWFRRTYATPTPPQAEAWPLIQSGRHVLIAAPTGSGKTLAAFLAAIDALVRLGVRHQLRDETRIVYVSPLKALSNDIHKNLEEPLAGIRQELTALGYPDVEIRTLVRTGDTPQAEREKMRRKPPHILVTTPESLYILVTSESGRKTLASTRTVIVDEIHALAPNKRGAHLAISLERLEELTGQRLTRVGLSATQKPIEEVARFLVGSAERPARGLLDDLGAPVDLFDRDEATVALPVSGSDRVEHTGSPSPAPHPTLSRDGRGTFLPVPSPVKGEGALIDRPGASPESEAALREGQVCTASACVGLGPGAHSPKLVCGCAILDTGHTRKRDLAIEVPESPLEAVMSAEVWGQVYERLVELINEHRSTLVFVNTRRLAERLARALSERLGEDQVTSHHGSLAREQRLNAEQKLKRGELKALVATSSLELGIDVGHVDLVCQIATPRAISALLQRVGRSGHAVGGLPKGRLFPLSRDDLVECAALLDAVRRGELDRLRMPDKPLDVLAQQIAAEVACRECDEDELFELVRRAYPYRELKRAQFDAVVQMLAEGFSTRRGRSRAYLHRDAINHKLRDRKGLRLTAITCGGTIPDTADYNVVLEPEQQIIGTVNEDFAVESMAGDVFQLGNTSYRILRVEAGRVRVEDARGLPPSIPFWLGEAPARTDEVSWSVSRLREEIEARLDAAHPAAREPDPHPGPPPSQGEGGDQQTGASSDGRREELDPHPGPPPSQGEGGDQQTGASSDRRREELDPHPGAPQGQGSDLADASATVGEQADSHASKPSQGEAGSRVSPAARGPSRPSALQWLTDEVGVAPAAAAQIVEYYAAARAALGVLPTQKHLVFERFFDETGGTQLLIHSPFGSRINRAWGLSLRKRFCRKFNFELQAAATEDAIILSLTATHSFQLEEVARYLHSNSVRSLLVQAMLDAPMFMTRWRWNASIALALLRFKGGNKVPPQLQRMEAEDLIAAVFPDQLACQENIVGDREIPDHPLVNQTIADCLHEAMDIDGMERVLRGLESGSIAVTGCNLTLPSPLALEVLAARPYAFLDDAPLEERRTQAVMARRWLDPDSAADIGRLDPEAIARVREEAWPAAENADELHDALLWLGYVTQYELTANPGWERLAFELAALGRATALHEARGERQGARGEPHQARGEPHQARGEPHQTRGEPHQTRGEPHQARGEPHQARGTRHEARDGFAPSPSMGEGWGEGEAPHEAQEREAPHEARRGLAPSASTSAPSPSQGEGRDGGTISALPLLNPHPGPPPVRGREFISSGEGEVTAASPLASHASPIWCATERLPELLAVFPAATAQPPVQVPPQYAQRAWTREEALVELVRGRLEGLGPTSATAIAASLGVVQSDIDIALLALEGEGFAMRGSFTPHATDVEWCERRLLARINRYTVKRLRQEIEPIGSADFLRFLFDWQHVTPDERMEGPDAVAAVISQLEGFEAAAAAWEAEILPARVSSYEPAWLDDLCLAGRVLWTRLEAPKPTPDRERGPSPVRATPVTLLTRKNLPIWSALVKAGGADNLQLSARARTVAELLTAQGASFFDDIVHGLDLPRTFVEEALGELVAVGLVNSDGFSGLRALLLPSSQRKPFAGGRRRRTALLGVEDAGRWTMIRRQPAVVAAPQANLPRETVEQIARALLKRYGVVFWRLLAREAEWLPPWRDLLMAYRRMETRGEIRGGRFVAGFSGEQFALPEAVGVLRSVRGEDKTGALVCVSGADPLNLAGILVPGAKVPALYSNRVLFRDGVAAAALVAGEAQYFVKLSPEEAWETKNILLRGAAALPASVERDS